MSVASVQLGSSRCAGHATLADSPRGRKRWTPRRRLSGAPSEPPPNGHCAVGESALTERFRFAALHVAV
eukprot:11356630-Alexandrium_andersonii.AAC.1